MSLRDHLRPPAERSRAERLQVALDLAEAGLDVERARRVRELGDAAAAEAALVAWLRARPAPGQGCPGFRDAMARFEGKT